MTTSVHPDTEAVTSAHADALPDVIDHLLGIEPGDWLDQLRQARPQTRAQAQKSYEALLHPAAPIAGQVTRAERYAIASFVALLHGEKEVAAFYQQTLHALAPTWADAVRHAAAAGQAHGPYGRYPQGPLSAQDQPGPELQISQALRVALGDRLHAALQHAHFLVFHPRDAQQQRLQGLQAAGWGADDIVVLSQLVAFLSFQLRVVGGLDVLAQSWDTTAPVPQRAPAAALDSVLPENRAPGQAPVVFTLAELEWLPWIEPLAESELIERHYQGLVDAARAKSPYFRLLARDPDTLGARTRTDKDIFYNPAPGLPRAERELAAAATSRHNGCIYCAAVHARFASHFSKRQADVQRLLDEGINADLGARWNAIVDASVALTETPHALQAGHITALRQQGLDGQAIADLLHAAAFFNWANRLMLSLGEPQY